MVPRMARIEPGSVSRGGPSVEGFSGVRIRPGWTSRRGEETPGQLHTRAVLEPRKPAGGHRSGPQGRTRFRAASPRGIIGPW